MSYLRNLNLRLLMSTVFIDVLKKPIFKCFSDFCDAEDEKTKIKAYASFVSEIYANGASLCDYVAKIVFENENVYIKSRAKALICNSDIEKATQNELKVFQEFASLSHEDFKNELNVDYLSPFAQDSCDLLSLYEKHILNVDKIGYGIFSSYPMFRLSDEKEIEPIISADKTRMDKFIGYYEERKKVILNTAAFIKGNHAANVLLCGDAGTGKSSTVKAIANEYFSEGLRLIELRKDQLAYLPFVMGKISGNPLKFIIFIDDLSFNKSDDNFSMLKAALEGSASCKADNAVIYATSNRRHIIKENFSDRDGDDVHRNDSMQESLSLSERFGLVVLFSKPNKNLYLDIVHKLAERKGITFKTEELDIMAEAFALKKGNRSARCAEQFIDSIE